MIKQMIVEQHYNKNYKKLCNIVSNRLGNDRHIAEEAVQEAYTRALTFLDCCNLEEDDGFSRWFSTILNNAVRDASKEERNRGLSIEEVGNVDSLTEVTSIYKKASESLVKTEISIVDSKKHREILELYFTRGLSCQDIYKITSSSTLSSVKQVVQRFKLDVVGKHQ